MMLVYRYDQYISWCAYGLWFHKVTNPSTSQLCCECSGDKMYKCIHWSLHIICCYQNNNCWNNIGVNFISNTEDLEWNMHVRGAFGNWNELLLLFLGMLASLPLLQDFHNLFQIFLILTMLTALYIWCRWNSHGNNEWPIYNSLGVALHAELTEMLVFSPIMGVRACVHVEPQPHLPNLTMNWWHSDWLLDLGL